MMMILRNLAAAGALGSLVACGTLNQTGPAGLLMERIGPILGGLASGERAAAAVPLAPADQSAFTADALAANPDGFVLMGVPGLFEPGLARRLTAAGPTDTWLNQAGYTASFDDGLLIATRGLGFDLMAAETRAVRAALRQGGGSVQRVHEYLDDQDRITASAYDCTVASDGTEDLDLGTRQIRARKLTETCRGGGVQFENLYWLDANGGIIASRQFISPTVAYLRSNRL